MARRRHVLADPVPVDAERAYRRLRLVLFTAEAGSPAAAASQRIVQQAARLVATSMPVADRLAELIGFVEELGYGPAAQRALQDAARALPSETEGER